MYGEGFLCLQIYCMCFQNISITCSALVCIHVSVFFVCVCLTSSVVPQDGDTPPLFHVGQLTARPEHCARTDESTEETKSNSTHYQHLYKLNIPRVSFCNQALLTLTTAITQSGHMTVFINSAKKKNKVEQVYIKGEVFASYDQSQPQQVYWQKSSIFYK